MNISKNTFIIIIVVLAAIFLFMMSKKAGATKTAPTDGGGDDLAGIVSDIMDEGPLSKKDCRRTCQGLCSSLRRMGGGKQKCIKGCKGDCNKYGDDYVREQYP